MSAKATLQFGDVLFLTAWISSLISLLSRGPTLGRLSVHLAEREARVRRTHLQQQVRDLCAKPPQAVS